MLLSSTFQKSLKWSQNRRFQSVEIHLQHVKPVLDPRWSLDAFHFTWKVVTTAKRSTLCMQCFRNVSTRRTVSYSFFNLIKLYPIFNAKFMVIDKNFLSNYRNQQTIDWTAWLTTEWWKWFPERTTCINCVLMKSSGRLLCGRTNTSIRLHNLCRLTRCSFDCLMLLGIFCAQLELEFSQTSTSSSNDMHWVRLLSRFYGVQT